MPDTFTQLYIQLVFAVKGRHNFIKESFRNELEKYICGIVRNKNHKPLAIYCMPDHIHLLTGLNPDQPISDLVKEIKNSSGNFIKEKNWLNQFYWQQGYGAFSYSKSSLDKVIHYILNQPEHHKKKTFKEEYVDFLIKFNIEYDEKYLFEFYD
ncbi:IS200/IS605 family transposase [Parafilimonas sp.]|uniref:IS200/IS605 family transposase n=1 Tax=Parafilimonas sp. TaxID=1969739 RepID=UPI0039E5C1A4